MRFRFASIAAMFGLLCASSVFAQATPDKRRSGFDTMSARIQSMQSDDLQNPGMLWVADGEVLWKKIFGISFSCAHCHNDAKQSMKGVAAKYPDWDPIENRPVDLSQRINLCRTRHQLVLPLPPESVELLGLEAYVAYQSRGMPLAPSSAKELIEPRERGRRQYEQRIGQLNLSCGQCHDERDDRTGDLGAAAVRPRRVGGAQGHALDPLLGSDDEVRALVEVGDAHG